MSLTELLAPEIQEPMDRARRVGGKVITCWGSRSSGKSTIATNLAFEIASLGQKTILVDADSYRPAIAALLGITSNAPGITAVLRLARAGRLDLSELVRLTEEVTFQSHSLRVLTGINAPTRWRELDGSAIGEMIEFLRGEFDYIVVDVASDLEEGLYSDTADVPRNHASSELTRLADEVLGIFCSDPVGISRFLWDIRDAGFEYLPVANRVRSSVLGRNAERQLRDTLFQLARLKLNCLIPDDAAAIDTSQQRAQPLLLTAKNSKTREAIRLLALELLDGPAK